MTTVQVPPQARQIIPKEITAQFATGENLLWSGQPAPYVFMLRGLPNVAYGVTWSVLGAFWFRGALMADWQGWWRIVPWLSIPFILAGFSFFFHPMRLGSRARSTWYVITDRRAFIAELRKGQPPSLRVFSPQELAAMYIVKRLGRRKDLIFSPGAQENPQLTPRLESGFFGLENGDDAVMRVRILIQNWEAS